MRILMLGNSFTFTNHMPQMLAQLTGAEVVHHTRGGARLSEHLNPKTKLGLGDLIDIGVYIFLSGAMALGGAVFLYFYERSYGEEYYLEEYGTGFFSDFYGMLQVCFWLGVILLVIGAVVWFIGKRTEGAQVKELQVRRRADLDRDIAEVHGWTAEQLSQRDA